MARISFLAVFLFLVGCHLSAGNEKENVDSIPTGSERMPLYERSIRYWDTDNKEVRKAILKELALGEDIKVPGCPRIRYPLICDNEGMILENTCYFRMKSRERLNLLPIMVFTTTGIEQARFMCENEIRNNPSP